jgi:uncharacterized protein YkwD
MKSVKCILICLLFFLSFSAFSANNFTLPSNQWKMISLPANPGVNNTVEAIFGDDIATSDYGTDNKWVLYTYNTVSNQYDSLALNSRLEQGKGYWIIQITGHSVSLDMPKESTATSNALSTEVASSPGGNATQWTLVGFPFSTPQKISVFSLKSSGHTCNSPACDLDQAKAAKLVSNQVWIYDGVKYITKSQDAELNSWEGFWIAALKESQGNTLSLAFQSAHHVPALPKSEIQRFLAVVNNARSVGRTCGEKRFYPPVPALSWSDKLYRSAYEHSQDLAISNTFSHNGSGTESDWTGFRNNKSSTMRERIESYNYEWLVISENIAAGYETTEAVVQSWLGSPGHCANIMSSSVSEIGMAKITNLNTAYSYYWTQNFGQPK